MVRKPRGQGEGERGEGGAGEPGEAGGQAEDCAGAPRVFWLRRRVAPRGEYPASKTVLKRGRNAVASRSGRG